MFIHLKWHLILVQIFVVLFSMGVSADTMSKILFQSQMALISSQASSEPTEQSFQQAQQIFENYQSQIDPAAHRVLPRGKIEENVLLYIHSFTQGPHEVRAFENIFREKNFNVIALSFSGHELDENRQQRLNFRDYDETHWKADIQFALNLARQYGKKVWVMGYSTGGLLALQQVLEDSSRIHALLLAAPAFALQQDFAGLSCTGSFLVNNGLGFLAGSHEQMTIEGACLIRNTISQIFERSSLPSPLATSFVFSEISLPTFLLYTERDEVVDNWRAELWLEQNSTPIRAYRLSANDHATHADILTDYSLNQPMSRYHQLTAQKAISEFIQDHL